MPTVESAMVIGAVSKQPLQMFFKGERFFEASESHPGNTIDEIKSTPESFEQRPYDAESLAGKGPIAPNIDRR